MVTDPAEGLESFDLGKEQRRERLKWVLYGVGGMLFVVCGFYLKESCAARTARLWVDCSVLRSELPRIPSLATRQQNTPTETATPDC